MLGMISTALTHFQHFSLHHRSELITRVWVCIGTGVLDVHTVIRESLVHCGEGITLDRMVQLQHTMKPDTSTINSVRGLFSHLLTEMEPHSTGEKTSLTH